VCVWFLSMKFMNASAYLAELHTCSPGSPPFGLAFWLAAPPVVGCSVFVVCWLFGCLLMALSGDPPPSPLMAFYLWHNFLLCLPLWLCCWLNDNPAKANRKRTTHRQRVKLLDSFSACN